MTPAAGMVQHAQFDPLSAGAFMLTVLCLCLGAGALIGFAAGNVGVGVAVGAVIGVPASIAAVVARYRKRV
jgi:hypothetical protein